ncbi:MAG: hypothetical protein PUF60_09555 [Firmicutes bacterium]|nr:hypothetical protein [Bacillota bacterium]
MKLFVRQLCRKPFIRTQVWFEVYNEKNILKYNVWIIAGIINYEIIIADNKGIVARIKQADSLEISYTVKMEEKTIRIDEEASELLCRKENIRLEDESLFYDYGLLRGDDIIAKIWRRQYFKIAELDIEFDDPADEIVALVFAVMLIVDEAGDQSKVDKVSNLIWRLSLPRPLW